MAAARGLVLPGLLGLAAAVGAPANDLQSLVQRSVGVHESGKAAASGVVSRTRNITLEETALCHDVFDNWRLLWSVVQAFNVNQTRSPTDCEALMPPLEMYARNFANSGFLDLYKKDADYLKGLMWRTAHFVEQEAKRIDRIPRSGDFHVADDLLVDALERARLKFEEGVDHLMQDDWHAAPVVPSLVRTSRASPSSDAPELSNSRYSVPGSNSYNYWKAVGKLAIPENRADPRGHAQQVEYLKECGRVMVIEYQFRHSDNLLKTLRAWDIPLLKLAVDRHIKPFLLHDSPGAVHDCGIGFHYWLDRVSEGMEYLHTSFGVLITKVESVLTAYDECQGSFWRGELHGRMTTIDGHGNIGDDGEQWPQDDHEDDGMGGHAAPGKGEAAQGSARALG